MFSFSFTRCFANGLLPVPMAVSDEKIEDVYSVLATINSSMLTPYEDANSEARELACCLKQMQEVYYSMTKDHFTRSLEVACGSMAIIQHKEDLLPGAVFAESEEVNRRIAATVFTGTAAVRQHAQVRGDIKAVATCSMLEKVEMVLLPAAKLKLLVQSLDMSNADLDFSQEANLNKVCVTVPATLLTMLKKLSEAVSGLAVGWLVVWLVGCLVCWLAVVARVLFVMVFFSRKLGSWSSHRLSWREWLGADLGWVHVSFSFILVAKAQWRAFARSGSYDPPAFASRLLL
jgi:hypothetical protein